MAYGGFAHFKFALYPLWEFAPEGKQVRPTYTSFMSGMELLGIYSYAHFNYALYHFWEFALKQSRFTPTYTSFMSWMELLGRLFNTDKFSSGMIICFEWIVAINFVIEFVLVFIL